MINKTKTLGKTPVVLGDKDAIHVPIVSVVAGSAISPGSTVKLNEKREAVSTPGKGFGVADPFRGPIARGERFWALVNPDLVGSVSHHWDCGTDFSAPDEPVEANTYLAKYAEKLGVTYNQLIAACLVYVESETKTPYPGMLAQSTVEKLVDDDEVELYDLWYEWARETGHEFHNSGSECCPEYDYPECIPFQWV